MKGEGGEVNRYVWHMELGVRADNAQMAYEEVGKVLATLARGDLQALAKQGHLIVIGLEQSWGADMPKDELK